MAKKNKKNKKVESTTNVVVSEFNGRLLNYIGTGLLQLLVIALMAGIGVAIVMAVGIEEIGAVQIVAIAVAAIFALIGLAWACCIFINWETKHTVVSGYQLKFNGKALQLFGNWIKWTFLSVITIGIYALWLPIKTRKWRVKHTTATKVENANDEYAYPQPQVTFYTYPQN
jgi:lysylphosphatidylglycerol synthetase-like protein (DUF2156 family)